jgi:hypothetical protein
VSLQDGHHGRRPLLLTTLEGKGESEEWIRVWAVGGCGVFVTPRKADSHPMAVNGHDPLGRLYGPGGIGNPGPGLGYGLGVGARDVRLSNGPGE